MVLAGLLPNVMTAAFNFVYNMQRIQEDDPELYQRFWDVQWWINGIAFPVGIAAGIWMAMRTQRLLRSTFSEEAQQGATKVLFFGRFISLLLLALWIPAGLAFPIAVGWGHISGHSVGFYLHFFLSLALCGCGATAYPYFMITAMATHYFLPALVRRGVIRGPRRADFERVGWLNGVHYLAAAAVPMLGLLLIGLVLVFAETTQKWPLIAVSAGGLAWLGIVAALRRTIELDVAALSQLAVEEPRAGGRPSSRSSASHRRSSAVR
jgi:hypothetical protein